MSQRRHANCAFAFSPSTPGRCGPTDQERVVRQSKTGRHRSDPGFTRRVDQSGTQRGPRPAAARGQPVSGRIADHSDLRCPYPRFRTRLHSHRRHVPVSDHVGRAKHQRRGRHRSRSLRLQARPCLRSPAVRDDRAILSGIGGPHQLHQPGWNDRREVRRQHPRRNHPVALLRPQHSGGRPMRRPL